MIALAVASLFVGKYPLSIEKLLAGNEMQWRVFLTLRLSRTVVGVIGGFALGVAGFVYQTVFRNPLASPDIIGVSSGASAGAAAGILFLSGATAVTIFWKPSLQAKCTRDCTPSCRRCLTHLPPSDPENINRACCKMRKMFVRIRRGVEALLPTHSPV